MKNYLIFMLLLGANCLSAQQNATEKLIKGEETWQESFNTFKVIYITKTGKLTFPAGSKCGRIALMNEGQIVANGTENDKITFENTFLGGAIVFENVYAKNIGIHGNIRLKNSTIECADNEGVVLNQKIINNLHCENSTIKLTNSDFSQYGDIYVNNSTISILGKKNDFLKARYNITILNSTITNANVVSSGAVNISNSTFDGCYFAPRNTQYWYKSSTGWQPQRIQNNTFDNCRISVIVHEKCTYKYNTFGKDNNLVFSISSNDAGEPKIDHRMVFKFNNFLDIATTTIKANSPEQGERYYFSIGAEIPINLPNNYYNDTSLLQNIATDYNDNFKIPGKFNFNPMEEKQVDFKAQATKKKTDEQEIDEYNEDVLEENGQKQKGTKSIILWSIFGFIMFGAWVWSIRKG